MEPFYDPNKSYEENWETGPFGVFANPAKLEERSGAGYITIPFGIPAGPLVNGRFVKAALDKGFDVCVYKTVRTYEKKANQWPNVVAVDIKGDLTMEQAKQGVVAKEGFTEPLAITNSFGNPSYPVDVWQPDIADAVTYARKGQQVWGMIEGDSLEDWVLAARLMNETKVHGIEVNFSCPNEGDKVKRLLCFDAQKSRDIAYAIKNKIGDTPLVVKISYFARLAEDGESRRENQEELRSLVQELGKIVDGISAINTIPAPVYKPDGTQALPGGEWRLKSGICGSPIKWAGLDMVKRLKALRDELGMKYAITGVGGVMTPADYHEYRSSGADVVMSATGAMWNPHLAIEIKESLQK